MIAITDKIVALIASLSPEHITSMRPAERQRFADWCRRAADLAEPKPDAPKSGVLAALHDGRGRS